MQQLDELRGRVRGISTQVQSSLKTEHTNNQLAGWGQFLEANSQVYQIGPYGTAAGLAITEIAFPNTPIDPRITSQLHTFWNEQGTGKLFPQNVRLAFTVLGLARSSNISLITLRNEITAELRRRQLQDGSWSDAGTNGGTATIGHSDTTAWVVLALKRAGGVPDLVDAGSKWLAGRIQGSGSVDLVSHIGTAAAILGHPKPSEVPGLRDRGFKILKENKVDQEELISFFDFERVQNGIAMPMRDFLCFPAFYPITVLINGLMQEAGFLETIKLEAYRIEATAKMITLTDGRHPYKIPTAPFSSLVDQAIYALSYEQLTAANEQGNWRIRRIAPIYSWTKRSIIIQALIPLIFSIIAVLTIDDPTTVPTALQGWIGARMNRLVQWSGIHKPQIQLIVAILLALTPISPKKCVEKLYTRIMGR